jgi:DNA-binding NarL/FixJ family response regulator
MSLKLLIAADQPVLRLGLRQLLSHETDLEVCGEAANTSELLAKTAALLPDLAVVALPLDGDVNPGCLRETKAKHPPLKILAGLRLDDPGLACRMIRAGADGCIHWGAPLGEIISAIRTILQGNIYLNSRASTRLLRCAADGAAPDGDGVDVLSDRELYVFAMIGQGLTTQQIATELDLSPRTIESHRKKVKIKLQVRSAIELNRHAFQWWRDNG